MHCDSLFESHVWSFWNASLFESCVQLFWNGPTLICVSWELGVDCVCVGSSSLKPPPPDHKKWEHDLNAYPSMYHWWCIHPSIIWLILFSIVADHNMGLYQCCPIAIVTPLPMMRAATVRNMRDIFIEFYEVIGRIIIFIKSIISSWINTNKITITIHTLKLRGQTR